MACLAYENFAFCDQKMPNFWTYFSLMFEYMMGDCMAPCVRKFYIDELRVPNFTSVFSLNDFWVMQGSNPLASILRNYAFGDLKILYLFRPFFSLNV